MLFWSFHRGFFFDNAIKVAFKCFYKKGVIVSQVHENGMCVDKSPNVMEEPNVNPQVRSMMCPYFLVYIVQVNLKVL